MKSLMTVDHQEGMRKMLRKHIEEAELEFSSICEVKSAHEALDKLLDCPVDIVLYNAHMPDLGTPTFLYVVRGYPNLDNTKLVVVTTNKSDRFRKMAEFLGANAIIELGTTEKFKEVLEPLM